MSTYRQLLTPVHPGEILLHEFMEPMALTRFRLARLLNLPQRNIDDICRAIDADTALRFERLFGMSAQLWLHLQAQYNQELATLELSLLSPSRRQRPPAERERRPARDMTEEQ